MGRIGLFFGTDTGNTRKVAKMIVKLFEEGVVDLHNVAKASIDDVSKYDYLILGTPTLGDGELEENWQSFLPQFDSLDLTGKTVAIYGLGDQDTYGHEFVDAMFFLYEKVTEKGAKVIGSWPTEGYDYTASKAEIDGEFLGLVLDQDNQSELTKDRVAEWIETIKTEMLADA